MAGKHGVKELVDFALLFKVLAIRLVREHRGDGFQVSDVEKVLADPVVSTSIFTALSGLSDAGKELAEFDFLDGLALGKELYAAGMEVVEELRS